MRHHPSTRVLLALFLILARPALAVPPEVSIGRGSADMSATTGVIGQGNTIRLNGSVSFQGYGAAEDVLIPPGMVYMSYYIYGEGFENELYCTASGPDRLCNIRVIPGSRLTDAVRRIPSSYTYPSVFWINSTSLVGVCNGWVLSATKNANAAAYAIGTFTCGVRPEDTMCEITPTDMSINVIVNKSDEATGVVTGNVSCNRAANVRVRTPAIPDSHLHLGAVGIAPVAAISINGRPAGEGADMVVNVRADLTVTAVVNNTNNPGEYSGSTALVIEYL